MSIEKLTQPRLVDVGALVGGLADALRGATGGTVVMKVCILSDAGTDDYCEVREDFDAPDSRDHGRVWHDCPEVPSWATLELGW